MDDLFQETFQEVFQPLEQFGGGEITTIPTTNKMQWSDNNFVQWSDGQTVEWS